MGWYLLDNGRHEGDTWKQRNNNEKPQMSSSLIFGNENFEKFEMAARWVLVRVAEQPDAEDVWLRASTGE